MLLAYAHTRLPLSRPSTPSQVPVEEQLASLRFPPTPALAWGPQVTEGQPVGFSAHAVNFARKRDC